MSNVHRTTAIQAAERIRRYWRQHPDSDQYEIPKVEILPDYTIRSNLVNGYPPRRGE